MKARPLNAWRASGCLLLSLAASLKADGDANPPDSPSPQILLSLPLAVVKGESNQVRLRGLNLEGIEKISSSSATDGARVVLKGKGKSEPPKGSARETVGDTYLDLEVFLPDSFLGERLNLQATDAEGIVMEWTEPVFAAATVRLEQEANNGFAAPNDLSDATIALGCIQTPQDVDVYEFNTVPGLQILLEARASRYGSPLDPLLMVYDDKGNLLKSDDDSAGNREARIVWTPTSAGRCRIAVLDASDKGSETHAYLLTVQPVTEPNP